jgi:integrase
MPRTPTDHDALAFLAYQRATGKRPNTIRQYEFVFAHWANFLQRPFADANRTDAYGYIDALNLDGAKPGGVAARLRCLRCFYNWLCNEDVITKSPFKGLTVKVPDEIRDTPDEDAVNALLAATKYDRRYHCIATLLADTGARKGEIAALTVEDVDMASGLLRIRQSKTRARSIPLTDRAVLAVTRWLRQRGVRPGGLWASSDPYSLTRQAVEKHSDFTCHALRRAFAVRWLAAGGSETGLMRLAGWNTSEMVRVYTRARADELAQDEMRRLLS